MASDTHCSRRLQTDCPSDYTEEEEQLLKYLVNSHKTKGRHRWTAIIEAYNKSCTTQRTKQGLTTKWKRMCKNQYDSSQQDKRFAAADATSTEYETLALKKTKPLATKASGSRKVKPKTIMSYHLPNSILMGEHSYTHPQHEYFTQTHCNGFFDQHLYDNVSGFQITPQDLANASFSSLRY